MEFSGSRNPLSTLFNHLPKFIRPEVDDAPQNRLTIDEDAASLEARLYWNKPQDLDLSAAVMDSETDDFKFVFHNAHTQSPGIVFHGDVKTNSEKERVERISVRFDDLSLTTRLVNFFIHAYTSNTSLKQVDGGYVQIVECSRTGKERVVHSMELCRVHANTLFVGQLRIADGKWFFLPTFHAFSGKSVDMICRQVTETRAVLEDPASKDPCRRIVVHVTKGIDLAAKDKVLISHKRGTSDPYCCLRRGSMESVSSHQRKTLEPVWNDASLDLGAVKPNEKSMLQVRVFDFDFMRKDDFMGIVKIHTSDLYELGLGSHQICRPLEKLWDAEHMGEEVSGKLYLQVEISEMV